MAKADKKIAFIVQKSMRHDGTRYVADEEVLLTADEAKPLLELGTVVAAVVDKAKSGDLVDLSLLKKAELVAYAKTEHNLELSESLSKDELLAAIKQVATAE